jgi:Secretion system C-terminal sorting domain
MKLNLFKFIVVLIIIFSSTSKGFSQQNPVFYLYPNINGFTGFSYNTNQTNFSSITVEPTGTTGQVQNAPFLGVYPNLYLKLNPFISWDIKVTNALGLSTTQTLNADCANVNHYVGYNTDFNSGALAACWRGFFIQDNYAFNGSFGSLLSSTNSVFMQSSQYTSTDGAYLVSPKFEDLGTDKKIKFSLAYNFNTGASTPSTLAVGTMTNPYDKTTFHLLKKVSATATPSEKTIYLNNYNGIDKYIAYKIVDTWGSFVLDNFSYEQSVNCVDITNVNFSNITENTAQLNFTGPNQNSWELYIKNLLTGQFQTTVINQNPYTIPNLVGNTNYEIKLRAICDVGLYSNWTALNGFTTSCNTLSAGYYNSFEETDYLNPCWIKNQADQSEITTNSGIIYNPNIVYLAPQTGSKLIKITPNSISSQPYFTTPFVNDLSLNKRVRFSLAADGGYGLNDSSLLIGTMTNPLDPTTFTLVKTIASNEINDFENEYFDITWKEYIVNFDNYIGNGNYIAIKHSNVSDYDTFYIDDFYYESQPNCVQPINQKATNPKFNEVTLNWEQMPNITATAFQIEYGVAGFTLGTGTIVNTISSPTTLSNLPLDNTIYDYYIRSKCGTEYSLWTKKQTFKTKCLGVNAGYSTNFDNQINGDDVGQCWSATMPYLPSSNFSPTTFVASVFTNFNSGPKSIYIRNDYGNTADSTEKTILISPRLIGFDNHKKIRFKLKKVNSGKLVVGTLSSDNDYTTFTPYQTINIEQTNSNIWVQYEVEFSNYFGNDKFIGFKIGNAVYEFILIDDFEYQDIGCAKPINLSASQTTINAATLTWLDNINIDNNTSWELEYGPTGFTTGTLLGNITATSYVLSGLTEGMVYDFRVRANCSSSSVSSWSDLYKFKMSCIKNAPYYENFTPSDLDQNYVELLSKCWTFHENSNYASFSALENVNSSPHAVSLSKTQEYSSPYLIKNGMLVSPFLADFDNNKKIKFWLNLENSSNTSVIIGTILNPSDKNTFIPYQTINITDFLTQGKEYEVTFENYSGNAKHIAFKIDGIVSYIYSLSIVMDDLYYSNITSCSEPIDINVSNETNTTAFITWQAQPISNNYEIEYGTEGFTLGTGTIIEVTNANAKLLTNLVPSTKYSYYVRSICNMSSSLTVGPKSFSTSCNPQTLPWIEKFDSMSNYGINILPSCFKKGNGSNWESKNISTTSGYFLTGFDDTFYLRIDDFSHNIFTPTFNLEAGTTYTFSYKAKKGYAYSSEGINLYTGIGNTLQSMKNKLSSIATYPNYATTNYFKINTVFTPVVSGNYTFYINYYTPGAHRFAFDDLELKEGYLNKINNTNNGVIYNFDIIDDKIILESTQNAKTSIILVSSNNLVEMKGSTENHWNTFGNIWENNQNSITKINTKVDATTATSLFMRFDLSQTFVDSSDNSKFRVVVNGNVIGEISSNLLNRNENATNTYQYNLSQYIGNDIRISLQHIGKSIGDDAYLDNLTFSPTASLNSNEFAFSDLKVYPNPANNFLSIENKETINKVEISNISGQLLNSIPNDSEKLKLNISEYSNGIYFVKIYVNDKNKTIKVVKK